MVTCQAACRRTRVRTKPATQLLSFCVLKLDCFLVMRDTCCDNERSLKYRLGKSYKAFVTSGYLLPAIKLEFFIHVYYWLSQWLLRDCCIEAVKYIGGLMLYEKSFDKCFIEVWLFWYKILQNAICIRKCCQSFCIEKISKITPISVSLLSAQSQLYRDRWKPTNQKQAFSFLIGCSSIKHSR